MSCLVKVLKSRGTFRSICFQYQKLAWSAHPLKADSCVYRPQFLFSVTSFSDVASVGTLSHDESTASHPLEHEPACFSNVADRKYQDEVSASYSLSHQPKVYEQYILNELSNLVPIPQYNSAENLFIDTPATNVVEHQGVDEFLSADEKLRGVFFQNLKGKTAIESALTNAGVNVNLDVISNVVDKGNLGGEAMVLFFRWAMKQQSICKDTDCYNIIVKALGRRKFFDFMVEMLNEMRSNGIRTTLVTLSVILDSFVRARRISKAIEFFGKLEDYGWACDTGSLNVLLQCLCRRSHVGSASHFLNSMKGKVPINAATYNIIISGWAKFGRVGEIKKYLEGMIGDGFSPDCLTFSYLIEGLGRAGQIDEAVEIFESVQEKCYELDVHIYNAVITNFAMTRDFDMCMKYYKRMLSDRCDPNLDTYTTLISSLLKGKKVADALEMFEEMINRGLIPNTGTVTSFIERLCSYGPPYAAMMVYKKARKAGCKISLTAYKLLLMRLSRFGKCGMLLTLWDEMQESGHSSDVEVYEHIINGLANIGQLDNAVLVMEEAMRKGFCPGRLVYSKLNNQLLASNNVEKAYKLFLKIKAARRSENARRYWRANGWHF